MEGCRKEGGHVGTRSPHPGVGGGESRVGLLDRRERLQTTPPRGQCPRHGRLGHGHGGWWDALWQQCEVTGAGSVARHVSRTGAPEHMEKRMAKCQVASRRRGHDNSLGTSPHTQSPSTQPGEEKAHRWCWKPWPNSSRSRSWARFHRQGIFRLAKTSSGCRTGCFNQARLKASHWRC